MSMNKKTRSLINTKYESQRIYYQRREIKKKDKQIQELTNNWNKLEKWLIDLSKPKRNWQGDTEIMYMLKIDYILDKMKEIKEGNNEINN